MVLAIIPLGALILGYTFLLKMMSHMQSRLGPMDPGGFHGWFQLVGDGMKFLQKEDIMPAEADRRVFALAPADRRHLDVPDLPRDPRRPAPRGAATSTSACSTRSRCRRLSVIGVLMAGWASANKFALLGALRAAAQLIAYELPLLLAVVGVVIQAGTMNLQGIVLAQQNGSIFGIDFFGNPYILTQFVGFFLFLVAAQAELTQTPFDMPVAESRARRRVHGRVHRLPVPLLLHRRVRHRVRVRGARRHALPRRLGDPRRQRRAWPTCSARSCCS